MVGAIDYPQNAGLRWLEQMITRNMKGFDGWSR
jgi:hypothetical protein